MKLKSLREEEGQRIMDITLQAVRKGTGKGNCSVGQGQHWNAKGTPGGSGGSKSGRKELMAERRWQDGKAKDRRKVAERMVNTSETWTRRRFHSKQMTELKDA